MKITFKRDARPTGLSAVVHPYPQTRIKLGGKSVGWISYGGYSAAGGFEEWRIWLHVQDEAEKRGWKNVRLKQVCGSEPEARQFVLDHQGAIIRKNLYQSD